MWVVESYEQFHHSGAGRNLIPDIIILKKTLAAIIITINHKDGFKASMLEAKAKAWSRPS